MNFARTIAILAIMCFAVAGCEQPKAASSDEGTHVHADGTVHKNHYPAHGNGHSHEDNAHPPTGPNNGHLFAFDSDFQGEWAIYKANDLVRLYILDATGNESVPVKATVIVTREKDGSEFELDPENPDDEGKTAVYVLENSELSIAMHLGVAVELRMDDKTRTATIKPHKH